MRLRKHRPKSQPRATGVSGESNSGVVSKKPINTLRLSRNKVLRVLQWFPFHERPIDIDRALCANLNRFIKHGKKATKLTAGDCALLSRWFGGVVPGVLSDEDIRLGRAIDKFLSKQISEP